VLTDAHYCTRLCRLGSIVKQAVMGMDEHREQAEAVTVR